MTQPIKMLIVFLFTAAFWLAVILALTGCVTLEGQKPDGTKFKYQRLGNQELGGIVVEADGSFLIERQKSDNETLYQAINKLVDKVP